MPDYDFSRLSSRSFEQLIQTLGTKVLGPGTTIFGDGPDGAREATFEGKVPYPSASDQWDGYIVVQAKFKQRNEGVRKDGQWAIEQLRGELEKFASRPKGLRRPQYYLFCTNVILTPKPGTGSKEKLLRVFSEYCDRLPLKGQDVWDYDKLRAYLDAHSEVRRSYAAWITPGDVLAALASYVERFKPDFQKTITTFLQKEVLSDQYVNLDQAGHSTEEQIPMARVFVDLIATSRATADIESSQIGEPQKGFVHEILEAGNRRLLQDSSVPRGESTVQSPATAEPDYGRFVLIGGPGQGKSTTAQYLCQVYRTALLHDRSRSLSPECQSALNLISRHCKTENLPSPGARRFPIRVVLSDFAEKLASDKPDAPRSVLAYIAQRIEHRTTFGVSVGDIREWLANYPWFLVLDGLDEVPASSNRNQVLSAIMEFWVDVATSGGDLLVLATTRPQGYGRDFSPDYYAHRYLVPLSMRSALRYAERLTEARFGHDVERRKRVMERLTNASGADATARLMTSPLQVTIMATLVDRAGQPPPERWRLFSEYYDVIYKREMERDNPAAGILRNHKTNIDGIHQLAGLELQTEGERTGRTDARLSRSDFTSIVKLRLSNEGYAGDELDELCRSITDAATQRLVFLVGIDADRIGFEIRSLQEFMAAEALMEGTDGEITERLKAIAPITYWRNVFLFAAGKCFTHRLHLRDVVISVCDNLNEESDLDHRALTGSEVALDLVRDGTARQHPKYQNRLTRLSCRLVVRPAGIIHQLVADSYYDGVDQVFREEVPKGLLTGALSDLSGGISTASWLAMRGVTWALELADSNWPQEAEFQKVILKRLAGAARNPWMEGKLTDFAAAAPNLVQSFKGIEKLVPSALEMAVGLISGHVDSAKGVVLNVPGSSSRIFIYQAVSCNDPKLGRSLLELPPLPGVWESLRECGNFLLRSTKAELASWIEKAAAFDDWDFIQSVRWPWPLRACLRLAESPPELKNLAQRALNGEFGDKDDWLAAEARWTGGITPDDFAAFDSRGGAIGPYIRDKGFPFDSPGYSAVPGNELMAYLTVFLTSRKTIKTPALRGALAADALFVASLLSRSMQVHGSFSLSPTEVLEMAREAAGVGSQFANLDGLAAFYPGHLDSDWSAAFDQIGRIQKLSCWGPSSRRDDFAATIRDAFVREPGRRGLARILGRFAANVIDDIEVPSLIVPLALLTELEWPESPFRQNLIFLLLANPDLTSDFTPRLARQIAGVTQEYKDFTTRCLAIAQKRLQPRVRESLAARLCDALPFGAWEARSATFECIDDLLRLRRSSLDDAVFRSDLKLPTFSRLPR
jgi:hypothetical protein